MKNKLTIQNICLSLFFVWLTAASVFAQNTSFTYQGKLTQNGTPANGSYEMRFTLYDQAANGFQIGTPKTIPNIAVVSGVFTVQIAVGDWSFDQNDRFMEIAVRPQGNTNPFTALAPLQQITNAPKAIFSESASIADHSLSSDYAVNSLKLNGLDASHYAQKNANGEIVAPRFENLAADPAPASASNIGRVYFNTTTNSLKVSNGAAWVDLSSSAASSRRIQTFYANTTFGVIPCTSNIRSVSFTKNSAATRLRVTYRDSPYAGGFGSFSGFDVIVKIDDATFSPVTLANSFAVTAIGGGSFNGGQDINIVGYAEGISAGTHTLTTNYGPFLTGSPACYLPSRYLIEIEELP